MRVCLTSENPNISEMFFSEPTTYRRQIKRSKVGNLGDRFVKNCIIYRHHETIANLVHVVFIRWFPHFTMINVNGRGVLHGPPPTKNGEFRIKTQSVQDICTVVKRGNYSFTDSRIVPEIDNS